MKSTAKALSFVLITIFVDAVGVAIIIPVMPALLLDLLGKDLSTVALYSGWLMFMFAALQFLTAPVLGNLSDSFGRRPVLLISLAAYGVDLVIMGVAPSIGWLFAGRALSGIFGATYAVANAYVADVTTMEDRTRAFGWMGAAFGVGFVVGPAIGGLLGDSNPRLPFFFAAGLAAANVIYGYFVLPESLNVANRRPFSLRRANAIGALLRMARHPIIGSLLLTIFLYTAAFDANPATWTFVTMEKFGWTPFDIGLSMTFIGTCVALCQGFAVGPLVKRVGDFHAVIIGFVLFAVTFLGFAFATSGWLMYVWMLPHALASIAGPATTAILSKRIPANEQGELQGALSALRSVTTSFTPLLMTRLFSYFTTSTTPVYFPGAPFLAAALLAAIALIVVIRTLRGAS